MSSTGKSARRLVLIDPVDETRDVFAKRLRAHGFIVDEAPDAVAGAEMALGAPPSAIICDLWMPGVSGVQLCRLLCAEPATASVPIIVRSETDDPRNRFWSRHAGARALVLKGRMGELVRTLGDVLQGAEPESGSFFFQVSGGGQSDIRDRIAEHLDRALFASVLEGEVRALSCASSFASMFDSLSQLLTQLVDYRWVALCTSAPGYFAVHAHRRQAEAAEQEALQVLGITPNPSRTVRIHDDDALNVDRIERTIVCDLTMGDVRLGQLAFGVSGGPSQIDTIAPAVARELASVVRLVLLVEESQRLAMTDGLTGLKNRRAFIHELQKEITRSNRTGSPTSLLLLDLDHFKSVNDTHGHSAGDAVLVAVGRTLLQDCRAYDIVGRWGGEEFIVALPSTDEKNALIVAERLRQAIEKLEVLNPNGKRMPLSASIGAVQLRGLESMDAVVDRADRAMYAAKVGGRNRVCSDPDAVPKTSIVPSIVPAPSIAAQPN